MQMMRSLSGALVALLATAANAQFNGPAPLAWRWLPTSGVAASGSPLVHGDTIYVSCGTRVYAIDRVTGNRKWQFPAEEGIPGHFTTAPILSNGTLVATGDNKIMYGIDPESGQSKWSFVMPGSPTGQPISVDKNVVQAQSNSKLIALDATTGKSVWNNADTGDLQPYTIISGLYGQIASYNNSILYFTSSNELHSVDSITRKEDAWARPLRFTQLNPYAQPVVYNDVIYVASGQFLAAVSPITGTPSWQVPLTGEAAYSPTVSDQGAFVVTKDGNVMLYKLLDGSKADSMPKPLSLESYPATRPSAIGDKFVVPTTSGAIDLVDPATDSVLWSYVVRPITKMYEKNSNTSNGPGGFGGGGNGGGGGGNGGGAGQAFGGQRGGPGGVGGANGQTQKEITEIEASGPAVLDGQTLIVPAKDGSLLAFDKDLGVDLTPPITQMLFPTPGDQVAGLPPLLLFFRIRDEGSGVNEKTLSIKIDGKPYEYKYKRDGTATVFFSSETKNKLLADGRHVITVEVSDWLGNVAHETFSLTIDNSLPPIKIPGQPTNQNGRNGAPGGGGGGFGGGGDGGGAG